MVRHLVTWNFKDAFTPDENQKNAQQVKEALEGLTGIIPGILELKVITETHASSTHRILLNSLFESAEALAAYQIHPEHVKASAFVGSLVQGRVCVDYDETVD